MGNNLAVSAQSNHVDGHGNMSTSPSTKGLKLVLLGDDHLSLFGYATCHLALAKGSSFSSTQLTKQVGKTMIGIFSLLLGRQCVEGSLDSWFSSASLAMKEGWCTTARILPPLHGWT